MDNKDRHGTPPHTAAHVKFLIALGHTLDTATDVEYRAMLDDLYAEAVPAVADHYTLAGQYVSNAQIDTIARVMVAETVMDAHAAADLYELLAG